jgi:hypothetical protein
MGYESWLERDRLTCSPSSDTREQVTHR